MALTPKKPTRSKKSSTPKPAGVPTAKAVAAAAAAAEVKGQPAPAAVKAAVGAPVAPARPAPVAAPAPAKPAPAPAPAAVRPVAPAPKVEQKTISRDERQRMIEQAAYFLAEKHGFSGDSSAHWAAAEAEVDADLRRRSIRVA